MNSKNFDYDCDLVDLLHVSLENTLEYVVLGVGEGGHLGLHFEVSPVELKRPLGILNEPVAHFSNYFKLIN